MMIKYSLFFVISFMLTIMTIEAAEYNGTDIDGNEYSCSAYSYDTGNYYDVTVEFSGTVVTIYFDNGGYIVVNIDDEIIDDPDSISAYEYNKGVFWDLDVEID